MVDSTAGHELMRFFNACQGCNQIPLSLHDITKAQNVGVTYQRLTDKVLRNQIGRNVEVYVDNILVKTRAAKEIITDLEETFSTLLKLTLEVESEQMHIWHANGKFLG
ncbi:uncharacterized protein [Primulina eburnea]|uniref:uncharacterized protein n=1 Tax=Primulina eburnea TaxID=1245227 RepID=UPI003C6BE4D5